MVNSPNQVVNFQESNHTLGEIVRDNELCSFFQANYQTRHNRQDNSEEENGWSKCAFSWRKYNCGTSNTNSGGGGKEQSYPWRLPVCCSPGNASTSYTPSQAQSSDQNALLIRFLFAIAVQKRSQAVQRESRLVRTKEQEDIVIRKICSSNIQERK